MVYIWLVLHSSHLTYCFFLCIYLEQKVWSQRFTQKIEKSSAVWEQILVLLSQGKVTIQKSTMAEQFSSFHLGVKKSRLLVAFNVQIKRCSPFKHAIKINSSVPAFYDRNRFYRLALSNHFLTDADRPANHFFKD